MNSAEFQATCYDAADSLNEIADYADYGERELNTDDAMWLFIVMLSFRRITENGDDGDDDSNYRIDTTLR